jgi:penicillin-binding protein 1B
MTRRRQTVGRPWWRGLRRAAALAGIVGAIVLLPYLAWLDVTIRAKFDGKRWALPARVYARPLELYAGAPLHPAQLLAELQALNYREVKGAPDAPGAFARTAGGYHVVSRAFQFWDGTQPPVAFTVKFEGARVASLSAGSGQPLPTARLDPLEVGGIYPSREAEDRVLIRLGDAPPLLVKTLLTMEDRAFHDHWGISPKGIARALWNNLRGGALQGASTITQQLVKNFYLSQERSLKRKVNEALMSLLLEARYSKDEILETYLNEIYLGQDGARAIHGFGLASRFFFGRPLDELRAEQVALLVAVIPGPSRFDPRRHPERARKRRDLVLDELLKHGVLPEAEVNRAKAAPLGVTPDPPGGVNRHPAFMDLVRRQLKEQYREEDLQSEGLNIFTTMDPVAQRAAEIALATRAAQFEKAKRIPAGKLQGAVLMTGVRDGEVLAAVGGRDADFAGYNRALDAERQVGSLMKTAVYAAALEQAPRYTLTTPLDDSPFTVRSGAQEWSPENYDHQYHGQVPLYLALAHSYNVATARLGLEVGLGEVLAVIRRLGITRSLPEYPSVMLGAVELTPFEVARMYQTIAGGGFRAPLHAIREVLTRDGQVLQHFPLQLEAGIEPQTALLTTRALVEVAASGTARSVASQLPGVTVAGKTGTTNDMRDSWFAGFTGERLAVVWLGRDDNQPIGLSGGSGALKVWGDVMQQLHAQPLQLAAPEDIEWAWVLPAADGQSEADCSGAVRLPYLSGSVPQGWAGCSGAPQFASAEPDGGPASTVSGEAGGRSGGAVPRDEKSFLDWLFGK